MERKSAGLQVRRMTEADLEPLHRLLSDPEVMRYLEPPFTRAQTEAFLQKAGMGREPLIRAVEDGRGFAGYVIYHPYDETSMELGWVLASDRWGRGYALALTRQMICRSRENGRGHRMPSAAGGYPAYRGKAGLSSLRHGRRVLRVPVGREKRIDKGYPTFLICSLCERQ